METRKLPTISDLHSSDMVVLNKRSELNLLLNNEPSPKWIKDHPMARNVKYIPIERIEWLLTQIFKQWKVEIKRTSLIANSVVCEIRLHYCDVITGEWSWNDGVGAAPLQTDKGMGAVDFNSIKNDAVMKAAPAAESYAVKDAAEKLGKLFGKDLNRADKIGYTINREQFLASPGSINYALSLISTSVFDDDTKSKYCVDVESSTEAECERIINTMKDNQKDRISSGDNYTQTDIKNKLKSQGL